MADTVVTTVLSKGPRYAIIRMTNISDGTGESLVTKADISTYDLGQGVAPTKSQVKEIQWSIQGFTSVRLYWDHTTDDTVDVLAAGNGYRDYSLAGMLPDPATAGGTGDLLLTTAGATSGATYDILITLLLS